MFSTVDKLNNRVVLAYGLYGNQKVSLEIDKNDPFFKQHLSEIWQTASAYPTKIHLRELAESFSLMSFSRPPDFIMIEVKKCVFDPESAEVTYDIVNETTVSYDQISRAAK
jgi:hypothetical protein